MFSGIVTHTGKVKKIIKKKNNCTIEVISNLKFSKNEIGSSISCSGVCLTLEKYRRNTAKFFLSKETLSKSIFKSVKKGHIINLLAYQYIKRPQSMDPKQQNRRSE